MKFILWLTGTHNRSLQAAMCVCSLAGDLMLGFVLIHKKSCASTPCVRRRRPAHSILWRARVQSYVRSVMSHELCLLGNMMVIFMPADTDDDCSAYESGRLLRAGKVASQAMQSALYAVCWHGSPR